jgi:predicted hydrolase (HD superfamily)
MPLTYDRALELLQDWTKSPSLIGHARAVETVMRKAAYRYGAGEPDETTWAIAGLLHDADYDRWPEDHPKRIIAWLREQDEDAIAHAVSAHYTRWGVAFETPLDKALLACDELTGFVVACCLVRPGGIKSLAPSSVKKKLKDRGFAAKVDRDEVHAGVAALGVDLGEHIQLIIDALKPIADELGINGREDTPAQVQS